VSMVTVTAPAAPVAAGGTAAEVVAAGLAPPSPKPQPDFPAWNWAPMPEQMPPPLLLKAQHVEAQSLELRHSPPMNCCPTPFPMFLTPAGSGVAGLGRAKTAAATDP
jgi:hypothetical protein